MNTVTFEMAEILRIESAIVELVVGGGGGLCIVYGDRVDEVLNVHNFTSVRAIGVVYVSFYG